MDQDISGSAVNGPAVEPACLGRTEGGAVEEPVQRPHEDAREADALAWPRAVRSVCIA